MIYYTNKMAKLVLCEFFNPKLHGITASSDKAILTHYLVISSNLAPIPFEDIYDEEDEDGNEFGNFCNDLIQTYTAMYDDLPDSKLKHPIIRNYACIVSKPNYIQPHIATVHYLADGECVAIIKTMWLRIVQRTWKKIFKKKKQVIAFRSSPANLFYRQSHGSWPDACRIMPTLKGMLAK